MKPKEFCELFGISKDTLRFYRDSGLVNPTQTDNGFFSYSIEDVASLGFALKERIEFDTPVRVLSNHLNGNESANDIQKQLSDLTKKLEDIDKQIQDLEKKKGTLVYLRNYRNDLLKSVNTISEASFVSGLSYVKLKDKNDPQDIHKMINTGNFFHGLGFDTKCLNDEYITPDHIVGLIDRYSIEQHLSFKKVNYIHSSLKAIRYTVEIDNLHKLDTHIFDSLKEYVDKNGYTLYPYVTSILLDVRRNPERYIIMFRFLID